MLQATLVLITLDSHLVTLRPGIRCKKAMTSTPHTISSLTRYSRLLWLSPWSKWIGLSVSEKKIHGESGPISQLRVHHVNTGVNPPHCGRIRMFRSGATVIWSVVAGSAIYPVTSFLAVH